MITHQIPHEVFGQHLIRIVTEFQSCRCAKFVIGEKPLGKHFDKNNTNQHHTNAFWK